MSETKKIEKNRELYEFERILKERGYSDKAIKAILEWYS